MENIDFYTWKVIYPNGQIYYRNGIKLKDLIAPFRFELTALESNLKNFSVDIKKQQELIYFRRVTGHLISNGNNIIDKIIYCLGYKSGNFTKVTWMDPITKEERIQVGENITL